MATKACGIDIGGSGVKGAIVDIETGELLTDIAKVVTPEPATPASVTGAVADVAIQLEVPQDMRVGVSFPAPILHGKIPWMANLDQSWVGVEINEYMSQHLNRTVTVINDADAATIGEGFYGAGAGRDGTVIMTTLGTGIGVGVLVDGKLVPNLELGHLEIDGVDYETKAAARWRTIEDLSWEEYAARLQKYYGTLEKLMWPDLIMVGGGVSENADKFLPLIELQNAEIIPAILRNKAGIAGAARAAALGV